MDPHLTPHHPISNHIPHPTQNTIATEKPTYLKGSTDAIVTAVGLGGLTLVFLRTMSGYIDMW